MSRDRSIRQAALGHFYPRNGLVSEAFWPHVFASLAFHTLVGRLIRVSWVIRTLVVVSVDRSHRLWHAPVPVPDAGAP